jgi:DNA helicase HerA-like ATPase
MLAKETGTEQFVEFLLSRIRTMLGDTRINAITDDSDKPIELIDFLESYLGNNTDTAITIIDLSLVPNDIVHLVTAVISRIIFEALQRYRKITGNTLPTVLVAEEAHNFIKRYKDNNEEQNISDVCCKVFEKIAKEGRKFGLGLVISSQRPSELSSTVLSQCNTFLLHRISNDRDQEQVHKLLPDNMRGLLRELPTLPSRHAILLGWASELPVLVRMTELDKENRPKSDDPDFWNAWASSEESNNRWEEIVQDWQQN